MGYGKSLEEIWEWRKKLSKELEGLNSEEQLEYFNKNAQKACIQNGIKCKKPKKKYNHI